MKFSFLILLTGCGLPGFLKDQQGFPGKVDQSGSLILQRCLEAHGQLESHILTGTLQDSWHFPASLKSPWPKMPVTFQANLMQSSLSVDFGTDAIPWQWHWDGHSGFQTLGNIQKPLRYEQLEIMKAMAYLLSFPLRLTDEGTKVDYVGRFARNYGTFNWLAVTPPKKEQPEFWVGIDLKTNLIGSFVAKAAFLGEPTYFEAIWSDVKTVNGFKVATLRQITSGKEKWPIHTVHWTIDQ